MQLAIGVGTIILSNQIRGSVLSNIIEFDGGYTSLIREFGNQFIKPIKRR